MQVWLRYPSLDSEYDNLMQALQNDLGTNMTDEARAQCYHKIYHSFCSDPGALTIQQAEVKMWSYLDVLYILRGLCEDLKSSSPLCMSLHVFACISRYVAFL